MRNSGLYANIARAGGALIAIGGTAGEYVFTGEYDPAKWLAAGGYTWAFGDLTETVGMHMNENMDSGTHIRLLGNYGKTGTSAAFGTICLRNIGANPSNLIAPIGVALAVAYPAFEGVKYIGTRIKNRVSPSWKIARELQIISKKLRNEKSIEIPEIESEIDALRLELQKIKEE